MERGGQEGSKVGTQLFVLITQRQVSGEHTGRGCWAAAVMGPSKKLVFRGLACFPLHLIYSSGVSYHLESHKCPNCCPHH